jgi:pimeloyl-ACP methyl ester carboxylesterase
MSPLHVLDIGEGPALVLLHAFPCDGRMWLPVAEALAEVGWRVLVPDLPGFGSSPLPSDEPGLDVVAAQVVEMLEGSDVDRAVLAGVSLGGYVTMAILRARPDLVAGVVLCDTKATADAEPARANRERLATLVLASPEESGRILEQAVLPGLLGDTTRASRPEVVERVRAWLDDASAESVAWYQRAMAARPESLTVLAASPVPTLVVWGDEDALSSREEQDLMLSAAVDADLVVVSGAGHLANVEDPQAVIDALHRYLDVVRGPQTS